MTFFLFLKKKDRTNREKKNRSKMICVTRDCRIDRNGADTLYFLFLYIQFEIHPVPLLKVATVFHTGRYCTLFVTIRTSKDDTKSSTRPAPVNDFNY